MTDEELKEVLDNLVDNEEGLLKTLLENNMEMMEMVYDLQEFMEEQGLTADQFTKWRNKKDLRMYH